MSVFACLLSPSGRVLIAAAALIAAPVAADAQSLLSCSISRMAGVGAVVWRGPVRVNARAGQGLRAQDRIITDPITRLEIRCAGGAVFTLGPATDMRLNNMAGGAPENGGSVRIYEGAAGFFMPEDRRGGGFDVHTPVAVASVRSTRWAMEVGAAPDSSGFRMQYAATVFVDRGAVQVSGAQKLRPNQPVSSYEAPRPVIAEAPPSGYGDSLRSLPPSASGYGDSLRSLPPSAAARPAPLPPAASTGARGGASNAPRAAAPSAQAAPQTAPFTADAMATLQPSRPALTPFASVLTAGQGVDVGAQGQVGPVRLWGAGRVQTLRARIGLGW